MERDKRVHLLTHLYQNESESGIRQTGQVRIFRQLSSFPAQSKQTILNDMSTLEIEETPLITLLLSIFPRFNLRSFVPWFNELTRKEENKPTIWAGKARQNRNRLFKENMMSLSSNQKTANHS